MVGSEPKLLEITKIWSEAPHNAFTDLIFFKNRFWCAFRESDEHAEGRDGAIRIITSKEGKSWTPLPPIVHEGYDLRDPKLCETPDGELMLLLGGSIPCGSGAIHHSLVSFSKTGEEWNPLVSCMAPNHWLWRVTWHKGQGYGWLTAIPTLLTVPYPGISNS